MRCFLPCFSASKRQKHFYSEPLNNANDISISCHPIQQNLVLEESIQWISSESKGRSEEQECSDSLFSVSIGGGKPVLAEENAAETETETEVNSAPIQLHLANEVSGSMSTPIVPVKEPEPKQKSNEGKDDEEDRRMNQSVLEYRYGGCYDDDGYHDINLDDDDSYNEKTEKGSSESCLFSLSTDFSNRKRNSFSSTEKVDNEVSSKMVALQEDDNEVLPVLNPIENVSQGKVKVLNPIKKDKENINWIAEKTKLKVSSLSSSSSIRVDTSLSDWLVESENKENIGKRGDGDVEERAILRALTVEEIRKSSSVSKTCSKSNKCVKDGKQDWSSTIKNILEPAFEANVEN